MNDKIQSIEDISTLSEQVIDKFPTAGTPIDVIYCTYFLSIYGVIKDIQILLASNRFRNVPILIRSFFEAYVDFKIVLDDPEKIQPFILKSDEEELRVIDALLKAEHNEALQHRSKLLKEEIVARKSRAIKSPRIKDKFEMINMGWFYDLFYNRLSSHSHNDIKEIGRKFILLKGEGSVILKYIPEDCDREGLVYLELLTFYFLEVIKSINNKLTLGMEEQIKQIENTIFGGSSFPKSVN